MELNLDQYKKVVKYVKQKLDGTLEKEDAELENLSNTLKEYVIKKAQNGKFSMHYQPKYNNQNKTYSAEALFRMKNPESVTNGINSYQFVDPEVAFYFINETEGLTSTVVKNQVSVICKDAKNYNLIDKANGGEPNYKISINVPLRSLDKDFIQHLKASAAENKIKPSNIQIEILETENFKEISNYKESIDALKSMGVTFALDDFGSRNANEVALKSLDFDTVKIDKAILDDAKATKDYSTVEKKYNEIKSAHPEATVVIEGVDGIPDENGDRKKSLKEILSHLKQIGEMEYQGWGFSKAVPANELSEKIHEQTGSVPPGFGE